MRLTVKKIGIINMSKDMFNDNKPSSYNHELSSYKGYDEIPSYDINPKGLNVPQPITQWDVVSSEEPNKTTVSNPNKDFDKILNLVRLERERQDKKWGQQNHEAPLWKFILDEELGETAKSYLENDHQNYLVELIQSIAVMVAWAENESRRLSTLDIDIEDFFKNK